LDCNFFHPDTTSRISQQLTAIHPSSSRRLKAPSCLYNIPEFHIDRITSVQSMSSPSGTPLGLDAPIHLQSMMLELKNTVSELQNKVQEHSHILQRIATLEQQNEALQAENEALRAKLSLSGNTLGAHQSGGGTKVSVSSVPKPTAASWSTVAAKAPKASKGPKTPKQATQKHCDAIARGFNLVTGPQGYAHVYINRSRRFTRTEVRKNLRLLGVESSRIIDVTFPARDIIGLLVHVQYKPELLQLLAARKIAVDEKFEPLSPKVLADPKYKDKTDAEREQLAFVHNRDRCLRSLAYLAKSNRKIFAPVCRAFLDLGWIAEEDIQEEEVEAQLNNPFGYPLASVATDSESEMEL
jgi:hypothetical protein